MLVKISKKPFNGETLAYLIIFLAFNKKMLLFYESDKNQHFWKLPNFFININDSEKDMSKKIKEAVQENYLDVKDGIDWDQVVIWCEYPFPAIFIPSGILEPTAFSKAVAQGKIRFFSEGDITGLIKSSVIPLEIQAIIEKAFRWEEHASHNYWEHKAK